MEDETKVVTPEVTEEATPEVEEEIIDWEARAKKAEEVAQNQKIRAEKAERLAKAIRPEQKIEQKAESQGSMSSKDLLALMGAKVDSEDVSEVEEYAKFKGISIAEALKSSTMKTILSEKEEQRKVANATNTGSSKRVVKKASEGEMLEAAYKGEMPDDVEALAEARMNARKATQKRN